MPGVIYHKFRPILFSTPMVQAIMEGRKTQTRRAIKPQPLYSWMQHVRSSFGDSAMFKNGKQVFWISHPEKNIEIKPPAEPNDVFWVRETWRYNDDLAEPYQYKQQYLEDYLPEYHKLPKWKPGIHMPKEAARLFLKVINVRVQRIKSICEEDAIAEGVEPGTKGWYKDYERAPMQYSMARSSFMSLWKSINGPESWEANPWVWVYEFERIEKPAYWK